MPRSNAPSLWIEAFSARDVPACSISEGDVTVNLSGLAWGAMLPGRSADFRGRSVLVATTDQLTTALALFELDGVARRLILCPPDLQWEHLPFVIAAADVDTIISDLAAPEGSTSAT